MRLLLVAPRDELKSPIGLAYIAASAKSAGHHVDCCYFETEEDLLNELSRGYDMLGTGGMSQHFKQIRRVVSLARGIGTPTVVGGNIITSEPELMLDALKMNFGVIGQGEETIIDLLACLESSSAISEVDGLCYMEGDRCVTTGSRCPSRELDSLPLPDWDGFQLDKSLDAMRPSDNLTLDVFDDPRLYNLVAARSCPFSCTFCYHPDGEKYRQRSVDSVMQELEVVVPRYRINIVSILDDLFAVDEGRVRDFCQKIRALADRLGQEIRWSCQMRADGVNASLLAEMRDSGCYAVGYGLESYSATVLKSMKKRITPGQIKYAIEAAMDSGISVQGNFIFGDVAETMQTARETLDFWSENIDAMIGLGFIRACPGSAIYQHCIEHGVIESKLDHIANHLFDILNMTTMSDGEFGKLVQLVKAQHDQIAANRRVVLSERTADSVTVRCPNCRQLTTFKNYPTSPLFKAFMFCRHCRRRLLVCSRLWDLAFRPALLPVRRLVRRLRGLVAHSS
jgi:anaerobic magnesium-protoporphyrin IX monomethyl ester cyclase